MIYSIQTSLQTIRPSKSPQNQPNHLQQSSASATGERIETIPEGIEEESVKEKQQEQQQHRDEQQGEEDELVLRYCGKVILCKYKYEKGLTLAAHNSWCLQRQFCTLIPAHFWQNLYN